MLCNHTGAGEIVRPRRIWKHIFKPDRKKTGKPNTLCPKYKHIYNIEHKSKVVSYIKRYSKS